MRSRLSVSLLPPFLRILEDRVVRLPSAPPPAAPPCSSRARPTCASLRPATSSGCGWPWNDVSVVEKTTVRLKSGAIRFRHSLISASQSSRWPPHSSRQSSVQVDQHVQPAVELEFRVDVEVGVDLRKPPGLDLVQPAAAEVRIGDQALDAGQGSRGRAASRSRSSRRGRPHGRGRSRCCARGSSRASSPCGLSNVIQRIASGVGKSAEHAHRARRRRRGRRSRCAETAAHSCTARGGWRDRRGGGSSTRVILPAYNPRALPAPAYSRFLLPAERLHAHPHARGGRGDVSPLRPLRDPHEPLAPRRNARPSCCSRASRRRRRACSTSASGLGTTLRTTDRPRLRRHTASHPTRSRSPLTRQRRRRPQCVAFEAMPDDRDRSTRSSSRNRRSTSTPRPLFAKARELTRHVIVLDEFTLRRGRSGAPHASTDFLAAARATRLHARSRSIDVSAKAPPTIDYFVTRFPRYRDPRVATSALTDEQIDSLIDSGVTYRDFYRPRRLRLPAAAVPPMKIATCSKTPTSRAASASPWHTATPHRSRTRRHARHEGRPLTWRRSRAKWRHVARSTTSTPQAFDFIVGTFWTTLASTASGLARDRADPLLPGLRRRRSPRISRLQAADRRRLPAADPEDHRLAAPRPHLPDVLRRRDVHRPDRRRRFLPAAHAHER